MIINSFYAKNYLRYGFCVKTEQTNGPSVEQNSPTNKKFTLYKQGFYFDKIRYDNADVRIFLWVQYICIKKLLINSVYIYLKKKSDKKQ